VQLGDSVSCQVGTLIEAFLAYWPSRSYLAEKSNIEWWQWWNCISTNQWEQWTSSIPRSC